MENTSRLPRIVNECAVKAFHDDEMLTIAGTKLVDRADAGVIEGRSGVCFAL